MATSSPTEPTVTFDRAKRRMRAWARVLYLVAEMRDALQHRIWLEDPADTHLEADCQTFCELTLALTEHLGAKKL